MKNRFLKILSLSLLVFCQSAVISQEVLVDWTLEPNYQLYGNAANGIGPRMPLPENEKNIISHYQSPPQYQGQSASEYWPDLKMDVAIPSGAFSVEMWVLHHVNQAVGVLAQFGDAEHMQWAMGYYGKKGHFMIKEKEGIEPVVLETLMSRGMKKYWLHLVGTYDGEKIRFYFNGELAEEKSLSKEIYTPSQHGMLSMVGYLGNEPYMKIPNLVKKFSIYKGALSQEKIKENRKEMQQQIELGILYPDLFHFTAGPYLHNVGKNSMDITFECDRPLLNSWINYGSDLSMSEKKQVAVRPVEEDLPEHNIYKVHLEGLKSAEPYFYEVTAIDLNGDTIRSGDLTFRTAGSKASPFSFAIIGDTEARPHINFQVGQLIWDERPDFIINLGDLTDGGKEPHKFEWNHEYFQGMNPLTSRIPMVPVPGNGEGDLYWYSKYHNLPAYYKYEYGNAVFFMLNSNDRAAFAPGGEQYEWLENELKNCEATWKFVCHHHAPYSSDENDYGNSWEGISNLGDTLVRKIVPLYEKYGVDIVMFGHLHTYQRTLPIAMEKVDEKNGVIYLQGGGGGGNLEDFTPNRSWFSAKTYRGHHYFTVSILGKKLSMRMVDTEGRMRDFLDLKK